LTYTQILLDKKNGIATITLNRPESLNALSIKLLAELEAALDNLATDDSTHIVILTGAGRAFSVGMDLKELRDQPVVGGIWTNFDKIPGTRIHELIAALPQVVIARVNGFCFTGALELVLASDLVVVAEDAVLADTHTKWGMTPKWGMSQYLPRRVGMLKARELSYTARKFSGREAAEMGLANYAPPADQLDVIIAKLCEQILGNSAHAIAAHKTLHQAAENMTLADGLEFEREARFDITDSSERITAFHKTKE
jgi:enoyl-CoA hydratase/carnithine racemase